ncbi:hypothetical protein ACFQHV_23895 [Promicromonospora thailandica]|uniref:Secreted protein n=1 Tax=Promicromonospora thailandica TaxID=765201 RepID=A0A9X2G6Y0_9MICO|nr:hypothetical protein [Promicromonospora thailandica]MCP2264369.1 hypothetical protein [Promicromonospora thailandica]BFF20938.1 hypothetical protein GCM10025730_44590 [Promicromonospora thailandica]
MTDPTTTATPRRAALLAAALLLVGTLTACGTTQDTAADPPVASVPDSTDDGTETGTGGDTGDDDTSGDDTSDQPPADDATPTGRPQLRMDDSPEREAALWTTYDQCLLDNGAQVNDGRQAGVAAATGGREAIVVLQPVPEEATTACADLLPLQPPELDPDINPDYHDDFVAWVTCMQEKGMPVHLTKDSGDPTLPSWTYDDSDVVLPDDADVIEEDCMLAAFGGDR